MDFISIPVYEAQTFERAVVGGRNRPWLLTVKTDRGISLYVTKFFVERDIEQQNALSREIYTGALARELGLDVPDFALITIDDAFKETLSDELGEELDRKHTRFAFGSKFIPGEHTYSPALLTQKLGDYDIESIFSFDVLVLNTDRRNKKPNILLGNDRYYLIDHEHTFSLPEGNIEPRQRVSQYNFKDHIFYKALNKKATYGQAATFDTFQMLFIV